MSAQPKSIKQSLRSVLRRSKAFGFTLFELMIVLVIVSVVLLITLRQQFANTDSAAASTAAAQFTQLGNAVQAYIQYQGQAGNALDLVGAPGPLLITATNLPSLNVAGLQAPTSCGLVAKPCLPASFPNVGPGTASANPYLIAILRTGAASPYTYAGVVTSKPWVTGAQTRLDLAGATAQAIGGNGLVLYNYTSGVPGMESTGQSDSSTNPTIPKSVYGAVMSGVGQVGYYTNGSGLNFDNTYVRLDGSHPMTGTLTIGSATNGITASPAGLVTANSTTPTPAAFTAGSSTAGSSISSKGDVSATGGQLLVGPSGAPTFSVTNTGAVTANGLMTANNGVQVGAVATGVALAANGAVTANGGLQVGPVASGFTATNAGAVTANGGLQVGSVANGFTATSTGAVTANGAITANGTIAANQTITVANTADIVMNSLAGASQSLTARTPQFVPMSAANYALNSVAPTATIPAAACAGGGAPAIQVTNSVFIGTVDSGDWGLQIATAAVAGGFSLTLTSSDGSPLTTSDNANGIAVIYCKF